MRYYAGAVLALALIGTVFAIAPPQDPFPPVIVPSPTTSKTTGVMINPTGPTPPTPEPGTLTIALVGVAVAGSFRLLRRKW
jgi:hypothetical protein